MWNNKPQVKKGSFGEEIIKGYLEKRGFIVYTPITNGNHCFDTLAIKDKKQAIIAECKAKACRNYYPDTGINVTHLTEYEYISKKHLLPVFLFFVDESLQEVYGNWLSELTKERIITHNSKTIRYPLRHNGIVYFPLIAMKRKLALLTTMQVEYLKTHSTRSYEYIING